MWYRRFIGSIALAVVSLGMGCLELPPPRAQYNGQRLEPRTESFNIEVLRSTAPGRPYQELGSIHVTCPVDPAARADDPERQGGCAYEHAISLARTQAAQAGADGFFNIVT